MEDPDAVSLLMFLMMLDLKELDAMLPKYSQEFKDQNVLKDCAVLPLILMLKKLEMMLQMEEMEIKKTTKKMVSHSLMLLHIQIKALTSSMLQEKYVQRQLVLESSILQNGGTMFLIHIEQEWELIPRHLVYAMLKQLNFHPVHQSMMLLLIILDRKKVKQEMP